MNEVLNTQRSTNFRRAADGQAKVQLTFYIPAEMLARSEVIVQIRDSEVFTVTQNHQLQNVVENVDVVAETVEAVVEVKTSQLPNTQITSVVNEPLPFLREEKLEIKDIVDDVIPYFSLKLKNQPAIYKVGTTFLKDIALGQKHFGFTTLSSQLNDLHLLVYGSFIHYSLKKSVLIVVRNLNDKSFDKYRANFTQGTLWKWKTSDWGNLCFIDYEQINLHIEEFNHLDLSFIMSDFSAILWSLPSGDMQDERQKASLKIISKVNSVVFVVSKGETKNKDLKKASTYFQCFDIPIKGVLIGEDSA